MAQIVLDVPDAQAQRVVDAFCTRFDYDNYVTNGGTMTRAQFTKAAIARMVKKVVRQYEVQQSAISNPPPDPGEVGVT